MKNERRQLNKREFLKASSALLASGFLSGMPAEQAQPETRRNWAGNYEYHAQRLHVPKTVDELRKIVRSGKKLKALGSRHSFNGIADTDGDQISLGEMNEITLNEKSRTVTVGAGIRYGQLCPYLDQRGYALHNLASLPHISVAGARATATHGSGIHNGNLSTAVSAVEMVTADGDLVTFSRDRDGAMFQGIVVDLGGMGVVTRITLDVQPRYEVSQVVYRNLSMDQLGGHIEEIFSSGYSVSLFTDWQNHEITQVWIKSRLDQGRSIRSAPDFFGAKLSTRKLHPIERQSAENCTEQMGVPGPWYERLPHFRMNFTPSAGDELQSEYFVPREKGYEAILAVERLREQITPHLFISELRTIAADDLWMSTCYKRAAITIHFTWKPDWDAVTSVLPMIEQQLAPFDARPHWAKVFTLAPSRLQSLYPRISDYRALLKQYDPTGKFRNEYLNANI